MSDASSCDHDLWPCRSRRLSVIWLFVLCLYTKFEVRRPSQSEEMTHFRYQHRPGDLDLWPWKWCTLLPVGWTTFLPISVFLWRFVLDLSANTCQMCHVTLRPWPLTLDVDRACRWCGSLYCVCLPTLKFVGLSFRNCVSINWPSDLDLWHFDLWNRFAGYPCDGLPFCEILASWTFHFSSYVEARDRRTDRQTNRQTALNL